MKNPGNLSHAAEDPNTPLPLTTLSQALSVVFMEAFPLARNITPDVKETQRAIQSLHASDVQLDHAYLVGADLQQIMLFRAFLRQASIWRANLSYADLYKADLSEADLSEVDLNEVGSLRKANLRGVKGLTKEKLEALKAKYDIIDEDSTTSPSRSPVLPPPS